MKKKKQIKLYLTLKLHFFLTLIQIILVYCGKGMLFLELIQEYFAGQNCTFKSVRFHIDPCYSEFIHLFYD